MHNILPKLVKEDKQWYAFYTTPRAEKQVELRLKGEGVETYLPIHLSPRKWSDRVKMVEVPLFPSYIFVHTTEPVVRSLLGLPGIVRIVFYLGKPAVIRSSEINAIRKFLEQARERELLHEIGEELLIACGPLKDVAGKVKKVGRTHLLLHLEQLGCTVSVALNQVVKRKLVAE